MVKTHGVTHWDPEGCWGCRIQTVSVAPSATPSRGGGGHALSVNRMEQQWDKDMPVAKRLMDQGYDIKSIDGVAELEKRVGSGLELEMGRSFQDVAKDTPSYVAGDAGSRRDVAKGAPEFRKRALEAHKELTGKTG